MGTAGVHRAATAFSDAAAVYEKTRPDYPPAAPAWLGEHLALGPGRRVLDLAAGTGKLTRGLVASGASVIALEPVEGMRRTLVDAVPGAPVVAGVAQAIPLGSETVDAITVAQALHWFATVEAVDEMHRVLRPGSRLAVVWNRRVLSDPLQATLHRLMAPLRGTTPTGASGEWRGVLRDTGSSAPRFVPEAQLRRAVEPAHRCRGCGGPGGIGELRRRYGQRRARAAPRGGSDRGPALPASARACVCGGDLLLPARRLTPSMGGAREYRVRSARAVAPPDAAVGRPTGLDRHRHRMALGL